MAHAKQRIEAYLIYAKKQPKDAFRCIADVPPVATWAGGSAASIEGAEPLTKVGFANASIPSQFLTKNEPPIRSSLTLPEFVLKNPTFLYLAQCFWMKSEGGTGRCEAHFHRRG